MIDGGPAFPHAVQNLQSSYAVPVHGMTLREYACIKLRVPRTGKPWLDEIINESRRDHFAGQAMLGELASDTMYPVEWRNDKGDVRLLDVGSLPVQDGTNWRRVAGPTERMVKQCVACADAMIADGKESK